MIFQIYFFLFLLCWRCISLHSVTRRNIAADRRLKGDGRRSAAVVHRFLATTTIRCIRRKRFIRSPALGSFSALDTGLSRRRHIGTHSFANDHSRFRRAAIPFMMIVLRPTSTSSCGKLASSLTANRAQLVAGIASRKLLHTPIEKPHRCGRPSGAASARSLTPSSRASFVSEDTLTRGFTVPGEYSTSSSSASSPSLVSSREGALLQLERKRNE